MSDKGERILEWFYLWIILLIHYWIIFSLLQNAQAFHELEELQLSFPSSKQMTNLMV